jgi:hypothetical protein
LVIRCQDATWPASWKSFAPPKSERPLTTTAGLSPADALKLEDDLIGRSIAYRRKNLSL